MTRLFPTSFAAVFVLACAQAAPSDQAVVAAMKVVESSNYTWTRSVPSEGRALAVQEGKTETRGYSIITFVEPQSSMLRQIARLNDGVALAVFKGEDNFVFQTSDGWKTGTELPLGPRRRRGGGGGTDYWISVQVPHEELEVIVGSYTEMHEVKGGVAGTLSEDGARQLLGSVKSPAVQATGTFIFAVVDDALRGYRLDLTGTVLSGPPGEEKETPTRRVLVTEIKNIGHTIVDVADEAKIKLSP